MGDSLFFDESISKLLIARMYINNNEDQSFIKPGPHLGLYYASIPHTQLLKKPFLLEVFGLSIVSRHQPTRYEKYLVPYYM